MITILGAMYLVIEIDEDRSWHKETILYIIALGTVVLSHIGNIWTIFC